MLLLSCFSFGQATREIPLYVNELKNNPIKHEAKETCGDSLVNPKSISKLNRVYSNISTPTYMLYPAADSNNKHIGVVILPGGGLVTNWLDKEGTDLALWLSGKGINCLVLKYRTNKKDKNGEFIIPMNDYKGAIYEDARTSLMRLRQLADSFNIDKDKIGIMGFSAGGWLSERMAFKYVNDTFDWKPNFVGLIYHGGAVKSIKKIKNKKLLPPFFMAISRDDKKIPIGKIIPFLAMVVSEVDKSELHIYSKGVHGFGLAYNNGYSVELWKDSYYRWLLDIFAI